MKADSTGLIEIIKSRRTIYPPSYGIKIVEEQIIEKIIEAGTWAPNHGSTEPWSFNIFSGNSRAKLAHFLSEEYLSQFKNDLFNEKKYENLKTWPLKSPVIIAVSMIRTLNSKIPQIEEERAVACCIQNMLLMATAFGISSYWSSGKVIYSSNMKSFLGLQSKDQVIALLYFGYTKKASPPKKRKGINLKTHWNK